MSLSDDEFDEILKRSLADGRLSRSERRALTGRFEELGGDRLSQLRAKTFGFARDRLEAQGDRALLLWLEDMVKALNTQPSSRVARAEACFSPGPSCRELIARQFERCRERADICVFTITDDRIGESIVAAHQRGVRVRIISDNDKSLDPGSDVERFAGAGIPVAIDRSDNHMHHKFAVFDNTTVLTGSYNWTRSAAEHNAENLVVLDDPELVRSFTAEFVRLWMRYFV